jgi:hypothetical protein
MNARSPYPPPARGGGLGNPLEFWVKLRKIGGRIEMAPHMAEHDCLF